jgi:hypothetical protein
MAYETYAERKRRRDRGGQPEVYKYDEAPPQLRHQIGMALTEGIGEYKFRDPYGLGSEGPDDEMAYDCWKEIDRACRKEVFAYLDFGSGDEHHTSRVLEALSTVGIDDFLSILEICCLVMAGLIDKDHIRANQTESDAAVGALAEINRRFEQHAVGYQYENGQIIRKDSRYMHAEAIKPALALLSDAAFAKANADFMTAHRHYRNGELKDAVTAANRAFETMLKSICDREGWSYGKGDRAAELVTLVSNNGLFTHDFDKGFSAYVAMLKTGLPTVRNDAGGHGEGLASKAVVAEIARYAVNMTASNIVFLGESYASFCEAKGKKP